MQTQDQGTRDTVHPRYMAVPRTLVFLVSVNPATGEREILLLKGAPHKRLWANRLNGVGGHVEANEDVHSAALREVREETGLIVPRLHLRGIVNIDTGSDEQGARPGVMMFVFLGETTERSIQPTPEGVPVWLPLASLHDYPLVDDLHALIPRTLDGPFFYGHYAPQLDGTLRCHFRTE